MRAWALFALVGCGFQASTSGDRPIDSRDPDPDVPMCLVVPPSVHVDTMQWAASFRTAPLWSCDGAGETRIDSQAGTVTNGCGGMDITPSVAQLGGGSNVMVVRLRELRVTNGHVLKLVGDKPIVFLVAGDVVVDSGALIDAGAQGMTAGPGAASCADKAAGRGETSTTSGWGGGGGGFGTAGGQGGFNVMNGGMQTAQRSLVPLRGGCAGAPSSSSNVFGAGGGAVAISATGTITIGATISAAGGGAPLFATGGGNGGGSGGGIHLVSPMAIAYGATGALRAHGGSGSSGDMASGSPSPNLAGRDGHATDDVRATDTSGTAGTQNNDNGRQGGLAAIVAGTDVTAPGALPNAQMQGGRGGGGGGGGLIVTMTATGATVCQ